MAKVADRVKETSTTTGTGTITLAGAVAGYRTFTSAFATGEVVEYCITDDTDWEVGRGAFTTSGTTLARTVIHASSNAGAAVNWAAGTRSVWANAPAIGMQNLTMLDKGNSSTTTQTFDYAAGNYQKLTVTGAHTWNAVSNWPVTGNLGELLIELVNGASSFITWPTINWVKSDGSVTTTFASNGVTLQTSGTDFLLLWTRDAGTTVYGKFAR